MSASRKRMGISQHVLSLLEKNNKQLACADSSEMEEQQKDRRKLFFYIFVLTITPVITISNIAFLIFMSILNDYKRKYCFCYKPLICNGFITCLMQELKC